MATPLGFKTFATGDVLTAADTNGYLMQGIWTFADAAARDAAVTSPQEGNTCYLKDTDNIMVYSGSAWVTKSGASVISLISTTSFTAVGSQSFNDVFSATYDNYVVEWSVLGSASLNFVARMRVAGSDNSVTGNYRYAGYNMDSNSTTLNGNASGTTVNYFYIGDATATTYGNGTINFSQPFPSNKAVTMNAEWANYDGTNLGTHSYHGGLIVNTSYTGFTLIALSGTLTGTVSIYGLAK